MQHETVTSEWPKLTENGKYESVAEMSVESQFDNIPAQCDQTYGIHQTLHYVDRTVKAALSTCLSIVTNYSLSTQILTGRITTRPDLTFKAKLLKLLHFAIQV